MKKTNQTERKYRVDAYVRTNIGVYAKSPEEALEKVEKMTPLERLQALEGLESVGLVGNSPIYNVHYNGV